MSNEEEGEEEESQCNRNILKYVCTLAKSTIRAKSIITFTSDNVSVKNARHAWSRTL